MTAKWATCGRSGNTRGLYDLAAAELRWWNSRSSVVIQRPARRRRWSLPGGRTSNERVFVIRGFNTKKDSAGQAIDFERVHAELIAPALKRCGLAGSTTGEVVDAGNIRADMFALILEADIVICDITVHNANVFYELGIRHALRKKHTVLIKGDPSADTTPFDLSTDRYLKYPVSRPGRRARRAGRGARGHACAAPRDRQPDLPDDADAARGRSCRV